MADQGAQDRHLPATDRKIEKAREDGQIARSRDLGHLAMVAGGGLALLAAAPALSDWTERLLRTGLRFDAQSVLRPELMLERLAASALDSAVVLVLIGAAAIALALAGGLGSGGWNWSFKAVEPKASKLNPLNGLKQMFSGDQMAVTGKSCLLALILGVIGAFVLVLRVDAFAAVLSMDLNAGFAHALSEITAGLGLLLLALATFAIVDVPLQRLLLARRLRMSLKEIKDEQKEVDGNPEVKVQIRHRMREMSRRRMMAAVPKADLVVMNPTHYAVALKYDEATMGAPRVVAKGADALAMRIRDLAREHGVPVLQAPALARALYAHTEIDREVPGRLFSAVAQVLAWVYQLRAARVNRQPEPPAPESDRLVVPPDLDPHNRPVVTTEGAVS